MSVIVVVVVVTFFNYNVVNCKATLILEIKNLRYIIQCKPNEIDKRINVSKIANNISTIGDNSTAAGCNSRLITVLVQHAHGIVSVT